MGELCESVGHDAVTGANIRNAFLLLVDAGTIVRLILVFILFPGLAGALAGALAFEIGVVPTLDFPQRRAIELSIGVMVPGIHQDVLINLGLSQIGSVFIAVFFIREILLVILE